MSRHNSPDTKRGPKLAELHSLDAPHLTAIEFPGKVVNVNKAVALLGGQATVSKVCISRGEDQLELRYRPGDPFEHPLRSNASKTHNILLEIKIPKKALNKADGDIQKAIQLSNGNFTAKPKYIIETNYRFREMSDFQYLTRGSPFVQKIKESIYTGNIQHIKAFSLDMKEPFSRHEDLDMLPPPKFSPLPYPYHYGYRQNAGVMVVDDGKGGSKIINVKSAQKLFSSIISAEDPTPMGPAKELVNKPITDKNIQECYDELVKLFDQRPIWTRRALEYHLPENCRKLIKFAIHRVAYAFRGGPWRASSVKYGIDPRSSPEYRFYQTRFFRVMPIEGEEQKRTRRNGALPYEFDGRNFPTGSLFQLCDITDPGLKELVENCPIRETCDPVDGWMESLQYERIIALFRAKYQACRDGVTLSDAKIQEILSKERTEEDKEAENEAENEENQYDSELENEDISGIGQEFASKLEASERALSEAPSGITKTHSEVSATTVDHSAKIQDLFGYVQQNSHARVQK